MLRATLKSLMARKLRLILSGLAVLLGVMFVSGSFVLTDAMGRSFDNMFANSFANSDVLVTADPAIDVSELEGESVPGTLTQKDRDAVAGVTGVASAVGLVQADGARVIGANGKVVETFGPPRFGENWVGEFGGLQLREGSGPKADNEIAVNAALAKKAGIKVGDQVGVLTTQPKQMFKLVGIFGYEGGLDSQGPVDEVRFTEPVAQKLMLGKTGIFTAVTVDTGNADPAAVRDAIKAQLGKGYVVQTGQEAAAAIANEFKSVLDFFNKILLGFAGVALFVGTFLILNTFSIIVAQRTKELALARALGASRGQMIGSVLVEAVVIGLVASVLGLAAGVGVGALLASLFASFSSLTMAAITVPAAAIISAFSVGMVITVIAAVLPAIRASRVPPVAALQEVATPDRPLTKLTVSGAIITALGGGGIAYGLTKDSSIWFLFGGVLAAFIGVSLLSPMLARPVVSVLGRIFSWSVPGKLGRLNSGRNPRRTAITAAALMVGIAIITGVNTIMVSAEKTLRGSVAESFHADLIISGQESPGVLPTFDPALLPKMREVPGVQALAAEYNDQAVINGNPSWMTVVSDLPALTQMFSLKQVEGTLAVADGEVIVDDQRAKDHRISVGSTVTVKHATGIEKPYRVAGIYQRTDIYGGFVFGPDAMAGLRSPQPSNAFVRLDGSDEAGARKALEALLVDSPEMSVQNQKEFIDAEFAEGSEVLLMIQVLLGLAILIAVLGVINTLALSVLERTREIGLLRAVGLGRMATMRMITVEAVVITVFGALLGLGVGVGLGAAVVKGLADEGLKDIVLPWTQMGWYTLLGAVVGVIAAVLPAIRAARVNVLQAISHE